MKFSIVFLSFIFSLNLFAFELSSEQVISIHTDLSNGPFAQEELCVIVANVEGKELAIVEDFYSCELARKFNNQKTFQTIIDTNLLAPLNQNDEADLISKIKIMRPNAEIVSYGDF